MRQSTWWIYAQAIFLPGSTGQSRSDLEGEFMAAIEGKLVLGAFMIACFSVAAQPTPGAVLWTFNAGNFILTSPALAPDGTIYVATSAALVAVTNNGMVASNRWIFPVVVGVSAGDGIAGCPAIAGDGTIYIGGQDGNLYAVNPDGSQKWTYQAQGNSGSPGIGLDGTIYFEGYSFLNAVTPAGRMKWKALVGDAGSFLSPALGPDGTIYIGCGGCPSFDAFAPNGTNNWSVALSFAPGNSAAVGAGATIYFTAAHLFAFTANGTNIWRTTTNNLLGASPVVGPDGTIYVRAADDHSLYAISSPGQVLWHVLPDYQRYAPPTCPAICANGTLYYCASNTVWALNSQGQVQWSVTAPGDPGPGGYFAATSPAVGSDGTVYAALANKLYAIA